LIEVGENGAGKGCRKGKQGKLEPDFDSVFGDIEAPGCGPLSLAGVAHVGVPVTRRVRRKKTKMKRAAMKQTMTTTAGAVNTDRTRRNTTNLLMHYHNCCIENNVFRLANVDCDSFGSRSITCNLQYV